MEKNYSKLTPFPPLADYSPSRELDQRDASTESYDYDPAGAYNKSFQQAMDELAAAQTKQAETKPSFPNNFIDLEMNTACINGYLFQLAGRDAAKVRKIIADSAIADLKKVGGRGKAKKAR